MYHIHIILREDYSPAIFKSLLFLDLLYKFIELFHLFYLYLMSYLSNLDTLLENFELFFDDYFIFFVPF